MVQLKILGLKRPVMLDFMLCYQYSTKLYEMNFDDDCVVQSRI